MFGKDFRSFFCLSLFCTFLSCPRRRASPFFSTILIDILEFCSCSLVRNTANTSNREEQGNAHAVMPFLVVWLGVPYPQKCGFLVHCPFGCLLRLFSRIGKSLWGVGRLACLFVGLLSGSLELRWVDLRPFLFQKNRATYCQNESVLARFDWLRKRLRYV